MTLQNVCRVYVIEDQSRLCYYCLAGFLSLFVMVIMAPYLLRGYNEDIQLQNSFIIRKLILVNFA